MDSGVSPRGLFTLGTRLGQKQTETAHSRRNLCPDADRNVPLKKLKRDGYCLLNPNPLSENGGITSIISWLRAWLYGRNCPALPRRDVMPRSRLYCHFFVFFTFGFVIKFHPGKAGSRLLVNGISARRADFSPSKHNSSRLAGTIFNLRVTRMRYTSISKQSFMMAYETATTGEGAKIKKFRWSSFGYGRRSFKWEIKLLFSSRKEKKRLVPLYRDDFFFIYHRDKKYPRNFSSRLDGTLSSV